MSSSTPIYQGATWRERWYVTDADGDDVDLTGATLSWILGDQTGTALLDLNSDDDSARFSTLDAAGSSSTSGPVVEVNLTPTESALDTGPRWHQLKVELDGGDTIVSEKHAIQVKDSLHD